MIIKHLIILFGITAIVGANPSCPAQIIDNTRPLAGLTMFDCMHFFNVRTPLKVSLEDVENIRSTNYTLNLSLLNSNTSIDMVESVVRQGGTEYALFASSNELHIVNQKLLNQSNRTFNLTVKSFAVTNC